MGNKHPVDPIAELSICLHQHEDPNTEKTFVKVFQYYNKSKSGTLNKEEFKLFAIDLFQV